ncbi:hypothetical protein [Reinekea sp. G2M2-21]|uniref:hypothetical protein n=1 Tax=Reinekea sp. G2M2-21 TaxID=2788942 RepID=UPI0018AB2951|nr:hypothetical protein [Reinekea sp. G2M2-21]
MGNTISEKESQNTPLSQASGRKKFLVAVPSAAVITFLAATGVAVSFTKMLAVILWAYAVVGLIELLTGGKLATLSASWETMASWKKFIISTLVIGFSIVLFLSLMPIVAQFV